MHNFSYLASATADAGVKGLHAFAILTENYDILK